MAFCIDDVGSPRVYKYSHGRFQHRQRPSSLDDTPSLTSAAPTFSAEDEEQIARIRARQSGKSYLASWAKSTISVPGGWAGKPSAQIIHTGGFSVWNERGEVVWESLAPGGYSPSSGNGEGRRFTLGGECFAPWDFKFQCKSKFDGSPDWCQVFDVGMNDLGWNYGNSDIDFYGAFITSSGSCAVIFAVPEEMDCGAEESLSVYDNHVIG
ncbi:hypothetical protein Q7P37_000554 [Cladosporium fusiforme]